MEGLTDSSVHKLDKVKVFTMSFLATGLLAAQTAPGEGVDEALSFVPVLVAVFLVFLIVAVPYLLYSTVVVWIGSRLMSFKEATVGKALKYSLLQLLIPFPVALALSVGVVIASTKVVQSAESDMLWAIVLAVLCFFIFSWLISVFITSKVYSTGFLSAAVFNVLLFILHGVIGFMLGAGSSLGQLALRLAAEG